MKPTITAFYKSPDEGKGMARDFRARWALEEVGQDYEVRYVPFDERKDLANRQVNPFGKIPAYEENGLIIFETGAIVLHIALRHPGLLPVDGNARERAIMWIFAALSTVEPPILDREVALYVEQDQPWSKDRMPHLDGRICERLVELSHILGSRKWLEDQFTAGDLMTIDVLRRIEGSGLLERYPAVSAYVASGKARPAFQRALASQAEAYRQQNELAKLA